jgi:hypothetical protein
MTPPRRDSHTDHLRTALEHAQALTDRQPEGSAYTESWSAQAAQFGDMTVLALAALRD